jgi:hypothetical protein
MSALSAALVAAAFGLAEAQTGTGSGSGSGTRSAPTTTRELLRLSGDDGRDAATTSQTRFVGLSGTSAIARKRFRPSPKHSKSNQSTKCRKSFSKTVLARRPRRDWLVPNAHCARPLDTTEPKDAFAGRGLPIRVRIPRERFRNLACNPIRRRAVRHADPDELSTVVPHDDEAAKQAEGQPRLCRAGSPCSLRPSIARPRSRA